MQIFAGEDVRCGSVKNILKQDAITLSCEYWGFTDIRTLCDPMDFALEREIAGNSNKLSLVSKRINLIY
jgi:hypothetical protein